MSHPHFAMTLGILAASALVQACSAAAVERTGATQDELKTCAPDQTLDCSDPGDVGDGLTQRGKVTCTCIGGASTASLTPPTPTIWAVTNLPHDTSSVHDASMGDFHGASAFVQPPELAAYGCTPTVFYYSALDLTVPNAGGGRLWACPAAQRAVVEARFTDSSPVSGSVCTGKKAYGTGTSLGGVGIGDTLSGWFFLGEGCLSDLNPGEGMSCSGPCLVY